MFHLKSDIFINCRSIILEIISTIFMMIASILMIVQGFDNDNYRNYKTREIKTERLLFSQFSNEVYSNILSSPFQNSSDNQGLTDLIAELKFNPSFDCRGVKDDELNEDICQDRILYDNWTCCRAECCIRTNGGIVSCYDYNFDLKNPNIYNHKILSYDEKEYFEDPRRRFCTYYNKYHQDIKTFMNQTIKKKSLLFNYKELLLNNISSFCISTFDCPKDYIDCGIIDTMDRHLFASDGSLCPVNDIILTPNGIILENIFENETNYKSIILRSIISEIPPLAHEYKNKTVSNDNELKSEEITIKDINKLLKNSKNIYKKLENVEIPLNSIGNGIKIESKMNKNSKFYWYTTNYIGFKTLNDLNDFEKYFNKSNPMDNCLYKIGENIYPYIKPIIIFFPLLIIFLYYLVFLILVLFDKISSIKKRNMTHFTRRVFILTAMLIIESVFYDRVTNEFKKIEIDMDENYKEILDLYNKRRYQLKYLLSIIFLVFAFVSSIIFFFVNCEMVEENMEILKNDNDERNVIIPYDDNINNDVNENQSQNRINGNNIINSILQQNSDRSQLNLNNNQSNNENSDPPSDSQNNNEENKSSIKSDENNSQYNQNINYSNNNQEENNNDKEDNKEQSINNINNDSNINNSKIINDQNNSIKEENNINNNDEQEEEVQPEFNNIEMKSNNNEKLNLKDNRQNEYKITLETKQEKLDKNDKRQESSKSQEDNKENVED